MQYYLIGKADFPKLVTPEGFKRGGREVGAKRYQITVILDPKYTNIAEFDQILKNLTNQAYPNGVPRDFKWPLKYGDTDDPNNPDMKGKYFIRCARGEDQGPPDVLDFQARPIPADQITKQVYAGCMVKVNVYLTVYDQGGVGVGAFMNHVQKLGEGKRLDGRKSGTQVFQPLDQPINADDWTPGDETPPPPTAPNMQPPGNPPIGAPGYQNAPQPPATQPPGQVPPEVQQPGAQPPARSPDDEFLLD